MCVPTVGSRFAASLAAMAAVVACSSSRDSTGTGGGGNPTVAVVTVTPVTFNLNVGDTLRFTAAAFATGGAPVQATFSWGAAGGTVIGGLFTAGATAGQAMVWAAAGSLADTSSGTINQPPSPPPAQVDTVFYHGFESNSFAIWDDRGLPGNHALDSTVFHSGNAALRVTFPQGSDGGWLSKIFLPGYDSIYVSEWVRFQTGWQSGTKLIAMYGSRIDNAYSAAGKAGQCPTGNDFFSLDVVQERSGNPGPTHFYSYYPGMAQSPPGSGTCYGLDGSAVGAVYYPPLEILPPGWHHVEYWIVLNTPGQSNLYQRFCVDGVLRGVWSGISARASDTLRLNVVTISNSISGGSPQTQQMWVDDLLVTRQRPPGAC